MDFSVAELTLILRWMIWIILVLSALLFVVWLLIKLLGRLAHRKSTQTDLDLIGHEAKVIRAIRPPHHGRIVCKDGGMSFAFNASSAKRIAVGSTVLITAFDNGVARTMVKESAAKEHAETAAKTTAETAVKDSAEASNAR